MKSSDYWRRREEEAKKHYLNQESTGYRQRLNSIYARQQAAIQKEIDAFYGKYAAKEGIRMSTAKKRAAKMDIDAYAAKAEKYVKEKKFTKKANAEMRLYNMTMKVNRLELLKAQVGLEVVAGGDELEKWAQKALQARALDEFRRMAGILGETVIDNTKMADQIVNASFHNATFSDRIWLHQDLLKHELDAALSTGLIQGRNPRALASEITKIFGAKRSDAERLMRTELARVQIGAQEQSLKDNDFDWYEFIAGQAGQCDVCASMDGKHFEVRKMVIGENAPPMHPNCRCSIAPWEAGVDARRVEDASVSDREYTSDTMRMAESMAYISDSKELPQYMSAIKDEIHPDLPEDLKKKILEGPVPGKRIPLDELNAFAEEVSRRGYRFVGKIPGIHSTTYGGFEEFRGRVDVLYEILDELDNTKKYWTEKMRKKGILIGYQDFGNVNDFARTSGRNIILNKRIYDDKGYLCANYKDGMLRKIFVSGTTYKAVIWHEIGHVIQNTNKYIQNRVVRAIEKLAAQKEKTFEEIALRLTSKYGIKELGEEYPELMSELFSALTSNNDIISKNALGVIRKVLFL